MANKRDLKKMIRRTCGGVAGECVLAEALVAGIDKNMIGSALLDVADLQAASLSVLSVAFDKAPRDYENRKDYNKARRAYFHAAYAKLLKDFGTHLEGIVKKMNEAMPAAEREANKKAAAEAK